MYSGNALVINLVMRFPILIPIAAACLIVTIVPEPVPEPVPVPETVIPVAQPASSPLKPMLPAIETICPPKAVIIEKLRMKQMTKAERRNLKKLGCDIGG